MTYKNQGKPRALISKKKRNTDQNHREIKRILQHQSPRPNFHDNHQAAIREPRHQKHQNSRIGNGFIKG